MNLFIFLPFFLLVFICSANLTPLPTLDDLREIFGGTPLDLFNVASPADLNFVSSQCVALLVTVSGEMS